MPSTPRPTFIQWRLLYVAAAACNTHWHQPAQVRDFNCSKHKFVTQGQSLRVMPTTPLMSADSALGRSIVQGSLTTQHAINHHQHFFCFLTSLLQAGAVATTVHTTHSPALPHLPDLPCCMQAAPAGLFTQHILIGLPAASHGGACWQGAAADRHIGMVGQAGFTTGCTAGCCCVGPVGRTWGFCWVGPIGNTAGRCPPSSGSLGGSGMKPVFWGMLPMGLPCTTSTHMLSLHSPAMSPSTTHMSPSAFGTQHMDVYLPVVASQGGLFWQGVAMLRQKALGARSQDLHSAKLPPVLNVPALQGLQSLPPWPALQPVNTRHSSSSSSSSEIVQSDRSSRFPPCRQLLGGRASSELQAVSCLSNTDWPRRSTQGCSAGLGR
jgi:hypothetical protein